MSLTHSFPPRWYFTYHYPAIISYQCILLSELGVFYFKCMKLLQCVDEPTHRQAGAQSHRADTHLQ